MPTEEATYAPEFVDIAVVPASRRWEDRFAQLPSGKAAKLIYHNRQRAYQVREQLLKAAERCKIKIATRIFPQQDGYVVYFWKKEEANGRD